MERYGVIQNFPKFMRMNEKSQKLYLKLEYHILTRLIR